MLRFIKSFSQRGSLPQICEARHFRRYCHQSPKSDNANTTAANEATTHFGFETIREAEKEEKGKYTADQRLKATGN